MRASRIATCSCSRGRQARGQSCATCSISRREPAWEGSGLAACRASPRVSLMVAETLRNTDSSSARHTHRHNVLAFSGGRSAAGAQRPSVLNALLDGWHSIIKASCIGRLGERRRFVSRRRRKKAGTLEGTCFDGGPQTSPLLLAAREGTQGMQLRRAPTTRALHKKGPSTQVGKREPSALPRANPECLPRAP